MKAVDTQLQYGHNPCAKHNFGCSHLCFYKPSSGSYCACPPGHYLSGDKKHCNGELSYEYFFLRNLPVGTSLLY